MKNQATRIIEVLDNGHLLIHDHKKVIMAVNNHHKLVEALENLLSDDGPILEDGWRNPYVKEAQELLENITGAIPPERY